MIAYSHCIAHGIEMRNGLDQQYRAVASGYWPLIRYDPMARAAGGNPFLLDSPRPRIPLADYTDRELRYRTLANTDPAEAERLHGLAEQAVAQRWEVYEEMATRGAQRFPADARKDRLMELSTDYMGLALRNPLVASASPLSKTVDGVRRLADAGVGAVVLYSLFEEQLRREAALNARLADAGTESFAESLSYFPAAAEEEPGPRRYLSLLERAAAAVDVPVIGSLNGVTPGGWADYARAMQDAGAAAIELNIYYLPGDPHISGRDVEQRHIDVLTRVKDAVTVPVAVKLEPALQLDRRDGAAARRGRRGRARALQPVPAARHRPRDASPWCPAWASPARPRPGCRAPGSRSCADACAPRSRRPPASRTPADVAKYLLAGADVVMTDVGAAAARPRARGRPARRPVRLDGAQGIRGGRRAARDPLGGARHRRGGARARGLRQRAARSQQQRLRSLVAATRPVAKHLSVAATATPTRLAGQLEGVVGRDHVRTDEGALVTYSTDATPLERGRPDAVVFPATAEEVAGVLRLANERRVPVVPRGSGTNLSAGTVPHRGGIVLVLTRMNKIKEVSDAELVAVCEPGVRTIELAQAAAAKGLLFPPDPGARRPRPSAGTWRSARAACGP